MEHFAGLDVSVKETSVCIVDDTGKIIREVKAASEPAALLAVLTNPTYHFKRIGLEAGPLSQWLFSALAEAGLPAICVETRHMQAVLKAQINKTDRNDARGIAQMMRAGLYRPVHVKTLRSQKLRMLLTHRKLLQAKAIAIENDLRATLRNFGLKVGVVGTVKFEARIKELVESIPDLAELVEPLLVVRRTLREQIGILHRRLLAIVRELLPKAIHIDVLADPANRETTESMLKGLEAAAPTMGMQIQVFNASAIREIDEAFAALANERPDALFIGVSPFLLERRVQLSQLGRVMRFLQSIRTAKMSKSAG